jgi:hypothetical protein
MRVVRVLVTWGVTRALTTCPYIPWLTKEYRVICSSTNREIYYFSYITPVLAASPDGEPPKQVIQQKII